VEQTATPRRFSPEAISDGDGNSPHRAIDAKTSEYWKTGACARARMRPRLAAASVSETSPSVAAGIETLAQKCSPKPRPDQHEDHDVRR